MDRQISTGIGIAIGLLACGAGAFWVFTRGDAIPENLASWKNPVPLSQTSLGQARVNYQAVCLECHGKNGQGDGPMSGMMRAKPPDLSDKQEIGTITDGEIFWIITKGHKPMPGFQSKLSEQERWALVHLMRDMSGTPPLSK